MSTKELSESPPPPPVRRRKVKKIIKVSNENNKVGRIDAKSDLEGENFLIP